MTDGKKKNFVEICQKNYRPGTEYRLHWLLLDFVTILMKFRNISYSMFTRDSRSIRLDSRACVYSRYEKSSEFRKRKR